MSERFTVSGPDFFRLERPQSSRGDAALQPSDPVPNLGV